MLKMHRIIFLLFFFYPLIGNTAHKLKPAVTAPIPVSALVGYRHYPSAVKNLIANAAVLSQQNLTYLYGSADPKNHGMDCSGTIYYLLNNNGVNEVPRSANDMYRWVKKNHVFNTVKTMDFNSTDFSNLKPGDLLFWSGTYKVRDRHSITHVMLYLGKNTHHQPLMFGSNNSRTYRGVSVFNFKLPAKGKAAKFLGYSCIPNLTC